MSEERKVMRVEAPTRVLLSRSIKFQGARLERLERKRQKAFNDLRRLESEILSAAERLRETERHLNDTHPLHMTVIRDDRRPAVEAAAAD